MQHHVHIRLFQELGEALTTSTGIVGRQLLWGELLSIVSVGDAVLTTVGNAVADVAGDVADVVNTAVEDALGAFTGWFDELGKDIQCARPPSNPRGSPR